jgi:hypothetical protein
LGDAHAGAAHGIVGGKGGIFEIGRGNAADEGADGGGVFAKELVHSGGDGFAL